MTICKYESCNNTVPERMKGTIGPNRLFCNKKCTSKQAVADKRRRNKIKVVEVLGGKCKRCGWKEHIAGLIPHHSDPDKKEFALGHGNIKSWARIEAEMKKCVLLCSNCHNVVHATNDPKWIVHTG